MNTDKRTSERIIRPEHTILQSLKQMDVLNIKSLIVLNLEEQFQGILSIGDIQRAIIKNIGLDEHISAILRPNPRYSTSESSIETIKSEMIKFRMEFIPVINTDSRIEKIFFWEDLFLEQEPTTLEPFSLPVVIMAGGFGSRLKPLTNVLPKPLIPIGEKSILEEIIARFEKHGCSEFHISVNYKAELIEYYLKSLNLPLKISFLKETQPSGTAGSLSMLKNDISSTFFVSNCDILINQDYSEILDYHKNNKNEITIVAALKHFPIAYGVIETGENGQLIALTEKPELTFKINSGMYILEPQVIDEIPGNSFYHITDLIAKLQSNGRKVGVFPVSQNSWQDIGDWKEYLKILNK